VDDERTFVIVGASLAGAKAAETLRSEGFAGRIVLIGAEEELPYERPPLTKGYLLGTEPRDKIFVHDHDWYADQRIELRLGTTVTGIDPARHTVSIGGEALHYDKLLLATGSRPRRLDVPGGDGDGVRYMRTAQDADAILADLDRAGEVLIIGAGWIGLEIAAAARSHGCDVTVVEVDRAPLRRVLGDDVAQIFRELHEANGVRFVFETGVRELGDLDGHVRSAVLDDGMEIAADLVIVGVGITPVVDLAVDAGIGVDNGVVCDASLATTAADVFACGDVASSYRPSLERHLRVEHWHNALEGGPAAARSMLGQQVTYDPVPYFFTDQYNLGMEYAGFGGPHDRVVFRGGRSVEAGFVVFWLDEAGHVTAGMNVNVWDVTDDIQAIIRSGRAIDPDRLADPDVALGDLAG